MDSISEAELSRRRKILEAVQEISSRIARELSRPALAREALNETIAEIQAMNSRALDRFEYGDEEVAWWTQVELYSGLAEPLTKIAMREPLTDDAGNLTFTPPRARMLIGWSEGIALGPRFRGQDASAPENVDSARETFVRPYSEAPPDMVWATILHWSNRRDA